MKKFILIILIVLSAVSLVFGGLKVKEYYDDKKKENHKDDITELENKIKEVEVKVEEKKDELEKEKAVKEAELKEVELWQKKVDTMASYL